MSFWVANMIWLIRHIAQTKNSFSSKSLYDEEGQRWKKVAEWMTHEEQENESKMNTKVIEGFVMTDI